MKETSLWNQIFRGKGARKNASFKNVFVCNFFISLRLGLSRKVYTPKQKERNYSEEIKKKAIKLYMEGNSGRAVGRILGISKNTCLYWIRKYAKKAEEKKVSNERVKVIEMDELYTYTERKKQNLRDNSSK